nr:MAG TPA: hypothetical protein [Caudoviricetes sp.]
MKKNTALKALCKVLLSSRKQIYIQRADGYTYISDGVVLIRIRAEIDGEALKDSTGIDETAPYICNWQQLRERWEQYEPYPGTMPAEILPVQYIYHLGRAELAVQYIRTYSGYALAVRREYITAIERALAYDVTPGRTPRTICVTTSDGWEAIILTVQLSSAQRAAVATAAAAIETALNSAAK